MWNLHNKLVAFRKTTSMALLLEPALCDMVVERRRKPF